MFLQWAPADFLSEAVASTEAPAPIEKTPSHTIFVKNLNFKTKTPELASFFSNNTGFKSAIVRTKPDGQSMGFGFLEFRSASFARDAITAHRNSVLDGHALILEFSTQKLQETRKHLISKVLTKLIIRNVPFEATKKELYELISSIVTIRKLRIPKRFDGRHRGFAFVDFNSHQEASTAFDTLKNSHFYGRHLVIEWAEEEQENDEMNAKGMQAAEDELNRIQKKEQAYSKISFDLND